MMKTSHRLLATMIILAFALPAAGTLRAQQAATPVELSQADVSKAVRQDIANEVRIASSLMPVRRSALTGSACSLSWHDYGTKITS